MRIVAALAVLMACAGGSEAALAATTASATTPGPLTLTVGTGAPLPAVVGQSVAVGLSITNTTAAPIGPFTFGAQVGPSAKLIANFPGVHVCAKPGGNTFSCTFAGQLQPGLTENSFSFTIVPQQAGPIDIVASITPTLGSDVTPVSAHLVLQAVAPTYDLQLGQSASTGQPAAGGGLTYAFQVKNTGPQSAPSATLTDTVPGDAVVVSAASSTGGACSIVGQTVSCSLGDVAASGSATVTVTTQAPTVLGTYANTGTVTALGVDANPTNDSATTTIGIR